MREEDTVKCFHTKGGTTVEFTDTENGEIITIRTPKGQCMEMADSDEVIRISLGGAQVVIDGKSGQMCVTAQKELILKNNGAQLVMDPAGRVVLQGVDVNIKSEGVLSLKGAVTKIN